MLDVEVIDHSFDKSVEHRIEVMEVQSDEIIPDSGAENRFIVSLGSDLEVVPGCIDVGVEVKVKSDCLLRFNGCVAAENVNSQVPTTWHASNHNSICGGELDRFVNTLLGAKYEIKLYVGSIVHAELVEDLEELGSHVRIGLDGLFCSIKCLKEGTQHALMNEDLFELSFVNSADWLDIIDGLRRIIIFWLESSIKPNVDEVSCWIQFWSTGSSDVQGWKRLDEVVADEAVS